MKCTEIVALLAKTTSTNGKELTLSCHKDNVIFKDILKHTYEPTWRYFMREHLAIGQGASTLESTYNMWASLLKSLRLRTITGYAAAIQVENYIKMLTPEDATLFKRILRKDLRVGVGIQTINSVFPKLIDKLKFMKAHKYEKGDLYKYGPQYMSLKIDCIRGLLRSGTIYSTGGRVIQGVQHLVDNLPFSMDLDMELTIPGKDFNTASGIIRSKRDKPEVLAMVFDTPENMPFVERYGYLQSIFDREQQIPGFKLLKHILAKSEEDLYNRFSKALESDYEGLVMKTANHDYQLKRSHDWRKLKNEDTIDAPIIGFKRGTGKYENTLGAVIIRLDNGVEVAVSGMPDHLKDDIWNNQERWFNHIIEVSYHEVTPDGSLRHPKFHRDRWDKTPN